MSTVTIIFKGHFYGEVADIAYFSQKFTGTLQEMRNHIKQSAFQMINDGGFEDVTVNVVYSDGEEVDYKSPLDL